MRPVRCDTCNDWLGFCEGEPGKVTCWSCVADMTFPSPGSAIRYESGEPEGGLAGSANKPSGRADPVQYATPAAVNPANHPSSEPGAKDGRESEQRTSGKPPSEANPPREGTRDRIADGDLRGREATPVAAANPVLLFKCPKCGLVKKWQLLRPPWPGALCYDCYQALAESMGAGREVP